MGETNSPSVVHVGYDISPLSRVKFKILNLTLEWRNIVTHMDNWRRIYYKLITFLSVDMEILTPWSSQVHTEAQPKGVQATEGCTGYWRVLKSPYLRIRTLIVNLSPVIVKIKTFWTPAVDVKVTFSLFLERISKKYESFECFLLGVGYYLW